MPTPKLAGTTPTSARMPYRWTSGTILVSVSGPDGFKDDYEIKAPTAEEALEIARVHVLAIRAWWPGEYKMKTCRKRAVVRVEA